MATAVSHAVFEPSPVLCTSFVGKDGAMPSKYDENTKARAVRLVHEHRDDYDSEWAARVAQISSATSKSAVSRRFGAMTETALAELLTADLSGLDLVALMIDGVHFAESCCIGIGIDGVKHPLALLVGLTMLVSFSLGMRRRQ
jgi:hypothetical protein